MNKKITYILASVITAVIIAVISFFILNSTNSESASTDNEHKSTVLIYMIGSDLESRGGAGTEDMEELKNSGINTKNTNIIVFAGGSPMWHNDITSTEKINVLELKENGFEVVTHMDISSMGKAESLAEFLNFGYENYPADSFGLVMWDHGNGPNIGYGKDMLFDKDSLTLSEMKEALSMSPFNSSNKLDWVGFDACLMSSAELVCVWDDHADYLVASQEVEPSFGWDYSIFGSYDCYDTKTFVSELCGKYLSTCVEYYNKKGNTGKEFTLACIDLSYGDELEDAINLLFSKASEDIGGNYNDLVKSRVATRAFGRATTSSEYDLIDLYDMAVNLGELYPEESSRITEIIDKMVLKNDNNTTLSCGLSIYYPFYNKYFFENGWSEAYENIGVFDSYRKYLEKYQAVWLNETDIDKYEASPVPKKLEDTNKDGGIAGTYILPLSPEQNETYAEAKVYILEKYPLGSEIFASVISTANVYNENGVLYADVSGKAIYAVNNEGQRTIPVTTITDKVGDITRFSSTISAIKFKERSTSWDESGHFTLQFALNEKTEELSLVSVLPYNPPTKADEISSTKLEDINLDDWDEYLFARVGKKYFTRTQNGTVPAFKSWVWNGSFYSEEFFKEDGLDFVYENIENTEENEYYVVFEITDTQGGMYCSELLKIERDKSDSLTQETPLPDIVLDWDTKEEIEIFNGHNVSVTIKKEIDSFNAPKYILSAKNNNDFPVSIYFKNILLNDVSLGDSYEYFYLKENSEDSSTLFYASSTLEPYRVFEVTDKIDRIDGQLSIKSNTGNSYYVSDQRIIINSTDDDGFAKLDGLIDEPHLSTFKGAMADRQVLYEDENSRITLLMFGKSSAVSENMYILFENLSEQPATMRLGGVAVNGKTLDIPSLPEVLPGNSKLIKSRIISDSYFSAQKINQIENISLSFEIENENGYTFDAYDNKWFPVSLAEHGIEQEQAPADGEVVYDQNDIRITVTGFDIVTDSNYTLHPSWNVYVENNSEYDVDLYPSAENNSDSQMNLSSSKVGSHQSAYITFTHKGNFVIPSDKTQPMPSFPIKIHMLSGEKLLYYCETPIIFNTHRPSDKTLYFEMSSESITLYEDENMTLCLQKGKDDYGQLSYGLKLLTQHEDLNGNACFDNLKINGYIVTDDYFDESDYGPSISSDADYIDIGSFYTLYGIGSIDTISGDITLCSYPSGQYNDKTYIFEKQPVQITFTQDGKIDFSASGYEKVQISPFMDALAEDQVLFEDEKLRISLSYFGTKDNGENAVTGLCFENLSEYTEEIYVNAFSANSITDALVMSVKLPAKTKTFKEISIKDSWFETNMIESIENVKLFFSIIEHIPKVTSVYERFSTDVVMKQHGTAVPFVPGENIVFDKNGIKIIVNKFSYSLQQTSFTSWQKQLVPTWDLTIINDTGYNIDLSQTETDGYAYSLSNDKFEFSETLIAANQRVNCTLIYTQATDQTEFPLRIFIEDWDGNRIFTDDEMTIFKAEEEKAVLTPFMDAYAEEQVLWETDEFCFKLIYFGNSSRFDKKMFFCLENHLDKEISIEIRDISVNSYTIPQYDVIYAAAHNTSYEVIDISEYYLEEYEINSISTLEVGLVYACDNVHSLLRSAEDVKWTSVNLTKSGKANELPDGTNVIFDNAGVKIILEGFGYLSDGREAWDVTVINSTDNYITFSNTTVVEIHVDTTGYKDFVYLSPSGVGPGKKIKARLFYNKYVPHETLNVNFVIRDHLNNILFEDDEIITLYAGDGEKFTKEKRQW